MADRARQIGVGSLSARLPVANPRDELGKLAATFNELLVAARGVGRTATAIHGRCVTRAAHASDHRANCRERRAAAADTQRGRISRNARHHRTGDDPAVAHRRRSVYADARRCRHLSGAQSADVPGRADRRRGSCHAGGGGDQERVDRRGMHSPRVVHRRRRSDPAPGRQRARQRDSLFPAGRRGAGRARSRPATPIRSRSAIRAREYPRKHRAASSSASIASTRRASATDGGAGLGLALARWIAQAHDGDIALATSSRLGSTFVITLPCPA